MQEGCPAAPAVLSSAVASAAESVRETALRVHLSLPARE